MRKGLLSGAVGELTDFFEGASATMEAYADRHGYVTEFGPWDLEGRDPYWMKLAAILDAWDRYEVILWVDADVVIQDDAPDIFCELPDDKSLGACEHITHEGQVFNVGVMVTRTTERMHSMFRRAWAAYDRFADHKWPDQAPVMEMLGYTTEIPVVRKADGEFRDDLQLLDMAWNSLPRYSQFGYFLHFAGMPTADRFRLLNEIIKAVTV